MSILTEKRIWERNPRKPRRIRPLTQRECANVRRVLDHLAIVIGGPAELARAMGMTNAALCKARQPRRTPTLRLAILAAYVAGVSGDDVLAGRWQIHECPKCGHVGPHDEARR